MRGSHHASKERRWARPASKCCQARNLETFPCGFWCGVWLSSNSQGSDGTDRGRDCGEISRGSRVTVPFIAGTPTHKARHPIWPQRLLTHRRGTALLTQGLLRAGLATLFLTLPWHLRATRGYYEMVLGRTRQPPSPLPRQGYQTLSSKCSFLQGSVSGTHPKAEVDATTQSAITGKLLSMRSNPINTGSSSPPHFSNLAGFTRESESEVVSNSLRPHGL